jgi:hypothetical protein
MEKHNSFWADARGQFNIFTIISALAGLTLVLLPWIIVWRNYPNPERLDTLAYANLFLVLTCILTDALLGAVIENGFWKARKAPDAVAVLTGDAPVINQVPTEPEAQ